MQAGRWIYPLIMAGLLSACDSGGGGGDDGDASVTAASVSLSGAGVKGPMVGAVVNAYALDTTATDFKGGLIGAGSTNSNAQITGLNIPIGQATPFILEIVADADTTDITTGFTPILTTLTTAVTSEMLGGGKPIYATPLTTMAVKLAIANADLNDGLYAGDADGTSSPTEFNAALSAAASQVIATVGFGMPNTIDIFTASPIVNDATSSTADLLEVSAYRTAVEGLSAVIFEMQKTILLNNATSTVTTDDLLNALATDLSDGEINGELSGVPIAAMTDIESGVITVQTIVETPVAQLFIPRTDELVTAGVNTVDGTPIGSVEQLIIDEVITTQTGTLVVTTELQPGGAAEATPVPAVLIPNIDNDNFVDSLDNCPLIANNDQADFDGDGIGDVCDLVNSAPTWNNFNWGEATWQ